MLFGRDRPTFEVPAVVARWEVDGCSTAALTSSVVGFEATGGVGALETAAAAAVSPAGLDKLFASPCLSAVGAGEVPCCLFAPGPMGAGFGG